MEVIIYRLTYSHVIIQLQYLTLNETDQIDKCGIIAPKGEVTSKLKQKQLPLKISGHLAEVVKSLKAYGAVGEDHILLIFYVDKLKDQLEQMRLFSEQVMPHFADA